MNASKTMHLFACKRKKKQHLDKRSFPAPDYKEGLSQTSPLLWGSAYSLKVERSVAVCQAIHFALAPRSDTSVFSHEQYKPSTSRLRQPHSPQQRAALLPGHVPSAAHRLSKAVSPSEQCSATDRRHKDFSDAGSTGQGKVTKRSNNGRHCQKFHFIYSFKQ